ncbi:MAG: C40 family peptidase [Muribaculaceae bacterium]|nr:C40 family peptidase [Muribaculaceae bacterium]
MKRILTIMAAALLLTGVMTAQVKTNNVLDQMKKELAPDARTAIWDVRMVNQSGNSVLVGTVGTMQQSTAIEAGLREHGVKDFKNHLVVLESTVPASKHWALVKLSVATLRTQGKHSAEVATQGLMGQPVHVLDIDGEWARVQMPDDYIAWVPVSSLAYKTEAEMATWRSARRFVVTEYGSRLVTEPKGDETVSDLVMGNILEWRGESGKWLQLATPDGRTGYVLKTEVAELAGWADQTFDGALIERVARRMLGSGYLWGGTSTKVTDCSGLVKVCYLANGIIVQRDASQQALTGLKIDDWQEARLGDLLFFGNSKTGRVTHVGIYLRDGRYIHCSGQVKVNSLDPASPDYLYSPLSISRIDGQIGSRGITAVKKHPWYF